MTGIIGQGFGRSSGIKAAVEAVAGGKVLQVLYDSVGQRQTTTSYS